MTDKRETVISNKNDNRNRSNDDESERDNENERVGVGDSATFTPTHSLLNLSHFLSFTTYDIAQSIHLLLQDTVVSLVAYQRLLPY